MCFIFILLRSYIFIDKKLTKQTTVTDNIKKLRGATAREDIGGAVSKVGWGGTAIHETKHGQYMGRHERTTETWN